MVVSDRTVTAAGTLRAPTSLASITVAPPFFETVSLHVEDPPEFKFAGLQSNPVNVTGDTSEIVADWALPLSVAVTVAV
ncbi:MAG: hypothetical protein LAQ30_05590 [Acidobacteriia bacterium]|nr:hypothetical protein [Terriglobia bacterium]